VKKVNTGKGCVIIIAVSSVFIFLCTLFWQAVWKVQNPHEQHFAGKFAFMMYVLLCLLVVFIAVFIFFAFRSLAAFVTDNEDAEDKEKHALIASKGACSCSDKASAQVGNGDSSSSTDVRS